MYKKLTMAFLLFALLFLFPYLAWSTIEGQWYVQVADKIKIKDEGQAAQIYSHNYTEDWEFNSDGTCKMGILKCTWSRDKNHYIVTFNKNELKDKLAAIVYADTGYDIVINLISVNTKIKQKKNGNIKAKIKVLATCVFQDDGSVGKLKYFAKYNKLLP